MFPHIYYSCLFSFLKKRKRKNKKNHQIIRLKFKIRKWLNLEKERWEQIWHAWILKENLSRSSKLIWKKSSKEIKKFYSLKKKLLEVFLENKFKNNFIILIKKLSTLQPDFVNFWYFKPYILLDHESKIEISKFYNIRMQIYRD